jgi:hypothetical protein
VFLVRGADGTSSAKNLELIGCHGGMGGYQTQPFVLHPLELPADDDALIGATAVHHLMKSWVSKTNGKGSGKDEGGRMKRIDPS